MDKGFTEIFLNLFEFQSRLLKYETAEERDAFVKEWLECIAFQRRGVNDFADVVMDRMIEYREKAAQRQKEYRERKRNGEATESDDTQPDEVPSADGEKKADKPAESRRPRKKPVKDDSSNPEKRPYGEAQNVFLTDTEYATLLKRNGNMLERVIEKLSSYKASTGKEYNRDFSAICNWVENEVKQEVAKADSSKTFKQRDREESAMRAREAFPEVMEAFNL